MIIHLLTLSQSFLFFFCLFLFFSFNLSMSDHASPEPQSTPGKYSPFVFVYLFVSLFSYCNQIHLNQINAATESKICPELLFRCSLVNIHSLSLRSISAWVQPDRRVLQEALPDWPVATGAGSGSPGWTGPEASRLGHPKDSNGQTLSGFTLCHQGS